MQLVTYARPLSPGIARRRVVRGEDGLEDSW
jgi:hypothetical protein